MELNIRIYLKCILPLKCILRRIFGPKRNENGQWRRLHNEELHSLYHSSNIVRVIKSRRLRWAGHVSRMEEGRSAFKILTGKRLVSVRVIGLIRLRIGIIREPL